MQPAERQKQTVAACRTAMPSDLEPLWDTILHAPNVALQPAAHALREAFPAEVDRMAAVLGWYGHGNGDCPICRMLVSKLVFTIEDPIVRLADALEEATSPTLLDGACLFLSTGLHLRYARPAGITSERFAGLQVEVRSLPSPLKQRLIARWEERGGSPDALAGLG